MVAVANATEYIFERGATETISCVPPSANSDVSYTELKSSNNGAILWIVPSQTKQAISVTKSRFTNPIYSYRKRLLNHENGKI